MSESAEVLLGPRVEIHRSSDTTLAGRYDCFLYRYPSQSGIDWSDLRCAWTLWGARREARRALRDMTAFDESPPEPEFQSHPVEVVR